LAASVNSAAVEMFLKVERPHDVLFEIFAFCGRIRGYKNRVRQHRKPKSFRLEANHVQRFADGHIREIDRNLLRPVVRIDDYIESRQFADGLVGRVRIHGHVQGNGGVGERLQLHRFAIFVGQLGYRPLDLRRRPLLLLPLDHVGRMPQLVLRQEAGTVDLDRMPEFRHGLRKGACAAQVLAGADVLHGGIEAHAHIGGKILSIIGRSRVSLLVILVGAIVVLLAFRTDSMVVRVARHDPRRQASLTRRR